MRKTYGIKLNKDVHAKATQEKVSVEKAVGMVYGETLDKMRSEVKGAADLNNIQLAVMDAGLDLKNSKVSDFIGTDDNEILFPAVLEMKAINAVDFNPYLSEIINTSNVTDSKDIRIAKLDYQDDDNKKKIELKDVAEGAELPKVQIKESKNTISIYKRGIQIVSSYEAIQDCPINMLIKTIEQAAIRSAYTQFGDAIKVLQNGDGNSNAAGLLGKTASASAITSAELIGFLFDYSDATNLTADRIICNKATAKLFAGILYNTENINGYMQGKTFSFPQLDFENLKVFYDSRLDKVSNKDVFLIYNKAQGVDKYTIANSIINEFTKKITNQTEIGTLSERCGFGKIDDNATKYVTLG
jgi:hypothetical protein